MARATTAARGGATRGGGLHTSVVRALALRILGQDYAPGDILPNEAELQAELGVSRTSVREAVRVLIAKGLLEARPRLGTRVRPREDWNRLDPEVLAWMGELEPDLVFIAGLIEARRIFEPAAAEFAAVRARASDLAVMEEAFAAMRCALPRDLHGYCEADLRFHGAILKASRNPVLAGLVGTIDAALMSAFRLTTGHSRSYEETLTVHGEVMEAIRLRDSTRARARMNQLIDVAERDLKRIRATLESAEGRDREDEA